MNIIPILTREWHCRDWQRSFYRQRLGLACTAGAALTALGLVDRFGGGINLRRMGILGPILGIMPFMVFILGLHGASSLLATERREGTLPLLLITRLSGLDIIFGKLGQAVLTQGAVALAALPGLILPILAMGMNGTEFCFLVLAYANVVFFSLALGLLGAVFTETRSAASWCLFFFLPILLYSTPFTLFLPSGKWMEALTMLQWLNPCAAVPHATSAAVGFRPGLFWEYLLTSHALAWLFAGAAGILLPGVARRQAGRAPRSRGSGWISWGQPRAASFETRKKLLDRNPFLWLNSRERWGATVIWLWVILPAAGWGSFIWMIYAWRALNVSVVFVIAIGLSWAMAFLCLMPAHAARQILSDRLTGAFEILLCTPATPKLIARGIWLALRRYFLLPVTVVLLLSLFLMISGYVTFGFGGMLDPADRPAWLIAWTTAIVSFPGILFAICWVALRRTLFARNLGEASAIAFVQVIGTLGFALWVISLLSGFSKSYALQGILMIVAALILGAFGFTARRRFLQALRTESR